MTEKVYLLKFLTAAVAAGWNITYVNDGGERIPIANNNVEKALEDATAVDCSWIYFKKEGEQSWIFIVLQDPKDKSIDEAAEVINDYTTTLTEFIDNFNKEIGVS